MDTNVKRAAALNLLTSAGIRRGNYAPPVFRLLWWLGIDVPPPHFASFWTNVFLAGSFFGVVWSLLMWLLRSWRQTGYVGNLFIAAVVAGVIYGLGMACYYAYGKDKHKFPSWENFGIPK